MTAFSQGHNADLLHKLKAVPDKQGHDRLSMLHAASAVAQLDMQA